MIISKWDFKLSFNLVLYCNIVIVNCDEYNLKKEKEVE